MGTGFAVDHVSFSIERLYVKRLTCCRIRFAIAFFLIGLPSLHGPFTPPQKIITSIATWCKSSGCSRLSCADPSLPIVYAVASAAGFLFFGCNFGEEAGAATEVWVLRACIVQGLQQVWGK
jgi:alpha-1,3-glucan synthase